MELLSAESQSESRAFTERPYLNSNEEEYFFHLLHLMFHSLGDARHNRLFFDSLSVSQAAVPSLGQ